MTMLRPGLRRAVVLAEALDDPLHALRHDAHPLGDGDDDEDQQRKYDDES